MVSEIEHFYRIEKFIESITNMDKLLEVIISEGCAATNAESCSLALYDENTNDLYFNVARGMKGEGEVERKIECIRMKMGLGIVGWVAVNMEMVNVKNAYEDDRFFKDADKQTGFVTRSVLAVPMKHREKLIGVVEAVNKRGQDYFSAHDEKVLSILASQAALIIENARLYEDNLRQARFSALGQGIAGTAHCIKNILNGIDGGAYILDLGLKRQDMENVGKGWKMMKKNVQFMKELVFDMLAYSHSSNIKCESADINQICTDVAELMLEKAKHQNIDIIQDLQPDLEEVNIDPKGIYECLLNLVTNAVDACDKSDGEVRISTMQITNQELVIKISDNGCGISKENLDAIFKIFFSTKGSKGTGLGLAVTQKIISEHGGFIEAESEIGVGTMFTIRLPMN